MFYTLEKSWTSAKDLEIGDTVVTLSGEKYKIEAIDKDYYDGIIVVYNFEVEDNHNYYVGDNQVLVHNDGGCTVSDKGSSGGGVGYGSIRAYRNIDVESIPIEYRADPRLTTEMAFKGVGKSSANSAGWERDAGKHFESLLDSNPNFWSEANVARIESGAVPVVDEIFVGYFHQYKNQMGDKLIHHHIGGGGQAAAVPQSLHKGFGGIHNVEKTYGVRGNDPLSIIGQVFTGGLKKQKK